MLGLYVNHSITNATGEILTSLLMKLFGQVCRGFFCLFFVIAMNFGCFVLLQHDFFSVPDSTGNIEDK